MASVEAVWLWLSPSHLRIWGQARVVANTAIKIAAWVTVRSIAIRRTFPEGASLLDAHDAVHGVHDGHEKAGRQPEQGRQAERDNAGGWFLLQAGELSVDNRGGVGRQ